MKIRFTKPLLCLLMLSVKSFGQTTSDISPGARNSIHLTLDQQLDSLFSSFKNTTPGIAVAIMQDDKPMVRKAYGMASLEFGVPFSHNTIVRMQYAEGREFIAIATVLMEQEGLLTLNDKVRKYFPKLPAWSEPVTIRDLLNHSSGFVDEWAVLLLTQASMGNRFDVSQFLNLLYNRPAPGIEPGKGYMYCNSDFGLLRLILEKASGENLSVWMKRNIFDPLEMYSTRLHDNKDEVITGFAHEYYAKGTDKYVRWTSDKTSPGGNYFIATSAAYLEKWAIQFANPGSFASKAIAYLKKDAALMPGKGKNYVFGIKENDEDGYLLQLHQGVNDRPYLSSVPTKGYSVIVLGNSSANYVQFHQTIMNWLMGLKKPGFKSKQFAKAPVKYTQADMEQLAGRYFDADTMGFESFSKDRKKLLQLVIHHDSLKWQLDKNTLITLEPFAPFVFKDTDYEAYLEFVLPETKNDVIQMNTHALLQNKVYHYVKDTTVLWVPSREQLSTYTGKYYSPHLDFYWTLLIDEAGELQLKRPTIADAKLAPETEDVFTLMVEKYANTEPFEVFVSFHRDNAGQITHFTVSAPRLMHLQFDKQQ